MSYLAGVSAFFGIFIIIGRAPLVFAPVAVINIWNMSHSKARVLGIISVVLGACFIYLSAVVF